jgi:hypothetical protein
MLLKAFNKTARVGNVVSLVISGFAEGDIGISKPLVSGLRHPQCGESCTSLDPHWPLANTTAPLPLPQSTHLILHQVPLQGRAPIAERDLRHCDRLADVCHGQGGGGRRRALTLHATSVVVGICTSTVQFGVAPNDSSDVTLTSTNKITIHVAAAYVPHSLCIQGTLRYTSARLDFCVAAIKCMIRRVKLPS